jgi:spore maturation protein SpmB
MTSDHESRFGRACLAGATRGLRTAWFLTKIIVPLSAAVAALQRAGALAWLGRILSPAMGVFGLPGEAAVALVSGSLVGVYGAIAASSSIPLTGVQMTVLALMVLTAHNLVVESAVQARSGTSGIRMALLRIAGAVVLGALLWQLLRHGEQGVVVVQTTVGPAGAGLAEFVSSWALGIARLLLKIYVIVVSLTIGTETMRAFGVFEILSRSFSPAMRFLALSDNVALLWLTATILGLAFGAGLIIDESREPGRFRPDELEDFNVSVAISHSLLEDTLLFLAIGAHLTWILVPRPIAAALAVRANRRLRRARERFLRESA